MQRTLTRMLVATLLAVITHTLHPNEVPLCGIQPHNLLLFLLKTHVLKDRNSVHCHVL